MKKRKKSNRNCINCINSYLLFDKIREMFNIFYKTRGFYEDKKMYDSDNINNFKCIGFCK